MRTFRTASILAAVAAIFTLGPPASAQVPQTKPTGAGVQYTCQSSTPGPVNTERTWVRCSDSHIIQTSAANASIDLSAGGGGGGGGGVSSVDTGQGLSGGPITTSGTIDLRLNASGGLVKNLGVGTNELGIGAAAVTNSMLANSTMSITGQSPISGGSVSLALGGSTQLSCPTCLFGTPTQSGDLMYSTSGGQAMSPLHDVAVGSVLTSGGVNAIPVWSSTLPSGVLPNAGPGAGTYTFATGDAVTLDAQGRVAGVSNVTRTLTGGTGINSIGDLSANRTVSIDLSFSPTWTGSHVFANAPSIGDGTGATKSILFTNAAASSSLSWNPTAIRTLTLPDATDTLVGRATTDTLTNKTISGASNTLTNISNGSLTNSSITENLPSAVFAGSGSVSLGGTQTFTLQTQSANVVWAGPTTGSAAAPTFRALVNADLPASGVAAATYGDSSHVPQVAVNAQGVVTSVSNVSISATAIGAVTSVSGTSPIASSGGQTPAISCPTCVTASPSAVGDILASTTGGQAMTAIADVGVGSFLQSGGVGGLPAWSTLKLPNSATTGDLLAATGTNSIGNLADVAIGSVLVSGGVGAAPSWGTVPNAALPNVGTAGTITFATGDSITTDAQGRVSGSSTVTRTLTGGTGINAIGTLAADRTISVDQSFTPTWTGAHSFASTITQNIASVTGQQASLSLNATTLATSSGTQSNSPGLVFQSQHWDTTALAGQQIQWMWQAIPNAAASPIVGQLSLYQNKNGGGYVERFRISDTGSVIAINALSAGTGGNLSVFGATFAPNTAGTQVSLGSTANTSQVNIGRSGISTVVTGNLSQSTGTVSLTGNGASSLTTSSGALTLTSTAAGTWNSADGTVDAATFDRSTAGAGVIFGTTATSARLGGANLTSGLTIGTGSGQNINFQHNSSTTIALSSTLFQWTAGTNKTINIANAAVDTAGWQLSINAGNAGTVSAANGQAGGQLFTSAGAGAAASGSFTAGTGGIWQSLAGTGGAGTASLVSGAGGAALLAAGNAGASGGAGQGNGGDTTVRAGSGAINGVLRLGQTNTSSILVGASGITTNVTGTLQATGNLTNDADSTRDIGTSGSRWNNIFVKTVSAGAAGLTLTGAFTAYVLNASGFDIGSAATLSLGNINASGVSIGKPTTGTTLNGNTTIADSKTLTSSWNGTATNQNVLWSMQNTTAATSLSSKQYSPVFEQTGSVWNFFGGANHSLKSGMQLQGIDSGTAIAFSNTFLRSFDGGAYAQYAALATDGSQTTLTLGASGNFAIIGVSGSGQVGSIPWAQSGSILPQADNVPGFRLGSQGSRWFDYNGIRASLLNEGLGDIATLPFNYSLTAQTSDFTYNNQSTTNRYGYYQLGGSARVAKVADPGAVTVTQVGTSGAASRTYLCVITDRNGYNTLSNTGSTTTSNSTLSNTNYDSLTVSAVTGAVYYDWYQTSLSQPTWLGQTTTNTFHNTGSARYGTNTVQTPVNLTASPQTPGSTAYDYWVEAVDADGHVTNQATVHVANGPSKIAPSSYVQLSWSPVGGASYYILHRGANTTPIGDTSQGVFGTSGFTVAAGGMVRTGGSTVTVTVPSSSQNGGHGFKIGDTFTISPGEANFAAGSYTVASVTSASVFTYTNAGSNVSNSSSETFTGATFAINTPTYFDYGFSTRTIGSATRNSTGDLTVDGQINANGFVVYGGSTSAVNSGVTYTEVLGGVGFQNGWGNKGSPNLTAGFYKDPLGFVHLKGTISGGTLSTIAFTLPAGYRPSGFIAFPASFNGAFGEVSIDSSGNVNLPIGASNAGTFLDGITFLATQ